MRATLLVPLALTMLTPVIVVAQQAPLVIFCKGECYAVDNKGTRTAVTKGARLGEGQRLVTGPGAYAQVKLGNAAELGLAENAQVGFDQRSVRDRDLVVLDKGRVRVIDGDAIGKINTRELELRTGDGTFALKGADVEVKAGSDLTIMKVNAGDAGLRIGQSTVPITREAPQGVTRGAVLIGKTFSLNEVALPVRGTAPAIGPGTTLSISPAPIAGLPEVRGPFPIVTGPAINPAISPIVRPTAPTIAKNDNKRTANDRGADVTIGVVAPVPIVQTQSRITDACLGCTVRVPPTTASVTPPKTIKATTTEVIAPTTETLNTTLSVILAPKTTFTTTVTSPTTTTTTSTSTLSTSTLSTCLTCTSIQTISPTTTTTTSTTTSTGTLSTTTLTKTTLSSTSLLLR
jgi:hypothetical protein